VSELYIYQNARRNNRNLKSTVYSRTMLGLHYTYCPSYRVFRE